MKFCPDFANNLENVEIFWNFLNFLGKIPISKEFEWFEWFGPSPIEPFNSGADHFSATPAWSAGRATSPSLSSGSSISDGSDAASLSVDSSRYPGTAKASS